MLVQPELVRSALSEYFGNLSGWRQQKFDMPPHLSGNRQSAESLAMMQIFVATLSDDDPLLMRLGNLPSIFETGKFTTPRGGAGIGNSVSKSEEEAACCGVDTALLMSTECSAWLAHWITTVEQEAAAFRKARAANSRESNRREGS